MIKEELIPLKDFLGESHSLSVENNCLYRLLLQTGMSDILSTFAYYYKKPCHPNELFEVYFNYAYKLKEDINNDECPQIKIGEYLTETADNIATFITKKKLSDVKSLLELAFHIMGMTYCLLDLQYSGCDEEEIPEFLTTIHSYNKQYNEGFTSHSFSSTFKIYRNFIDSSKDWKQIKKAWEERNKKEHDRISQYGQKITVQLLKDLFDDYNIRFQTQEKKAEFISIITGWNASKINGLLSSNTTIIPAKHALKVDELNAKLKSFGLNIALNTK